MVCAVALAHRAGTPPRKWNDAIPAALALFRLLAAWNLLNLWDPRLLWLHVLSDGAIILAFYCIPVVGDLRSTLAPRRFL